MIIIDVIIDKPERFYVLVPEGEVVAGVIMTDQLCSLDYRARQASFISECPEDIIKEVLMRIQPILFENLTVD